MRSSMVAAFAAVLAFMLVGAPAFCQTTLGQGKEKSAPGASESAPNNSISSQPGTTPPAALGITGQGQPGSTLDIAPQYGTRPREGKVDVIPNEREFQPGSDTASIPEKFEPGESGGGSEGSRSGARPYIGITVRYTTTCYLGKEERGLEIMTVDPNSPAQKAGLHGHRGMTSLGAAGVTAGAMLGPLSLLTSPLLAKAGALGHGGDMIVAVDDRRVRTEQEFQRALAMMKPGDTTYLTVIRPVPGGHKTLKLAVRLGAVGYAKAGENPASGQIPPATSR